MPESVQRAHFTAINPLHAILIGSTIPLFLGAVLSSWAYARTFEIQWTNFASWLVVGGLVFTGLALVWSVVELFGSGRRGRWGWVYAGLVVALFVFGFINALVLAKDAWAAMPAALIFSVIVLLLAIAANWAAHSNRSYGAVS